MSHAPSMSSPELARLAEPPPVSILSQAAYLIVSVHTALDDSQLLRLQHDLLEQVELRRARGIVIDVAALDVLDSFASRTLSQMARAARLKGAETVVVGIAPEVAMAMVGYIELVLRSRGRAIWRTMTFIRATLRLMAAFRSSLCCRFRFHVPRTVPAWAESIDGTSPTRRARSGRKRVR